jgi:hypothetical protein
MAARSPGSTFLDFGDPLGGLGQSLLEIMFARERQALERDQMKLNQQRLKQDQERIDFERAQAQGPAQAALPGLMQGLTQAMPALPTAGGLVPNPQFNPANAQSPALQALGAILSNPALSRDQQLAAISTGAGTTAQGIAPRFAAEQAKRQQDAQMDALRKKFRGLYDDKAYARFEGALSLVQAGAMEATDLPGFMDPSDKEKAETALTLENVRAAKTKAESDTQAQQYLASKGVRVPAHNAVAQLQQFHQLNSTQAHAERMMRAQQKFDTEKDLFTKFDNSELASVHPETPDLCG